MEDKLRAYMDHLFRDVPQTKKAVEIKEEILQNLVDKYRDLIAEGKSEEAAYNIAVASVGDLNELLDSLKEDKAEATPQMTAEYMEWKKKSAGRVTLAVMLYILCVVPIILLSELGGSEVLGVCLMFLIIAVATGILIYNNMTKPSYPKMDDTIMEEFKEWKSQNDAEKQARKSINGAMWAIITALYFVISFTTGAWYITWVMFLIGAALESVVKAIFDLKK